MRARSRPKSLHAGDPYGVWCNAGKHAEGRFLVLVPRRSLMLDEGEINLKCATGGGRVFPGGRSGSRHARSSLAPRDISHHVYMNSIFYVHEAEGLIASRKLKHHRCGSGRENISEGLYINLEGIRDTEGVKTN